MHPSRGPSACEAVAAAASITRARKASLRMHFAHVCTTQGRQQSMGEKHVGTIWVGGRLYGRCYFAEGRHGPTPSRLRCLEFLGARKEKHARAPRHWTRDRGGRLHPCNRRSCPSHHNLRKGTIYGGAVSTPKLMTLRPAQSLCSWDCKALAAM